MKQILDRWTDRSDRVPLALLVIFFFVVAAAGGSSRADVLGQAAVRTAAVLLMIALVATRIKLDLVTYRPLALILASCVTVIVLQLIPLPPAIWSNLPGRAMFVAATQDAGLPTPWRPIAIYPDGAVNALFSLLVPTAALLGVAALSPRGLRSLLPILLAWTIVSALITLLQASGGWFANPFINDEGEQLAGLFANRNHGAVFLAIGTASAAYWGFTSRRRTRSRVLFAAGVIVLLLLTNLVTGSRSGLICELLALVVGLTTTRAFSVGRERSTRTVSVLVGVGATILIATLIAVTLSLDRAFSVGRILQGNALDDTRVQAAPAVWQAIRMYLPLGSGAGSFDQAFRIVEPTAFLDPTYMNHAHNDWLELPLEYGLVGPIILLGALGWAARRSWAVWHQPRSSELALSRLGTIAIGLILIAAVSDYAARTPIMMTILVIAGAGLCASRSPDSADIVDRVALPFDAPSL